MAGGSRGTDQGGAESGDRGVTEFTGVAILLAFTVLITGSVGVYVLVDPGSEEGGPNANFSFQYIDDSSVLIVTHDRGSTFAAGNLTLRGTNGEATWSELANSNASAPVGPGSTVQLSRRNAYGAPVSARSKVKVIYTPPAGNETVLEKWDGT